MAALELTPAVLRALAEGVTRLHKGDLQDGAAADDVTDMMARDHKLLLSNYAWYPAADAHSGYIVLAVQPWGSEVAVEGDSAWATSTLEGWYISSVGYRELAPGTVLYHDHQCTIPLRTL